MRWDKPLSECLCYLLVVWPWLSPVNDLTSVAEAKLNLIMQLKFFFYFSSQTWTRFKLQTLWQVFIFFHDDPCHLYLLGETNTLADSTTKQVKPPEYSLLTTVCHTTERTISRFIFSGVSSHIPMLWVQLSSWCPLWYWEVTGRMLETWAQKQYVCTWKVGKATITPQCADTSYFVPR